jgi:opacity protein-like surface antigen
MKHFLLVVLLAVPLLASVSTRAWDERMTEKAAAEGEVVEGSLGRQIDDYLGSLASRGFTGAAMVVQNNKLVFLKGYGIAHRGRKLPATHQTLFHIGSVSKQFTGAAALKLEMEGRLRVSESDHEVFQGRAAGQARDHDPPLAHAHLGANALAGLRFHATSSKGDATICDERPKLGDTMQTHHHTTTSLVAIQARRERPKPFNIEGKRATA